MRVQDCTIQSNLHNNVQFLKIHKIPHNRKIFVQKFIQNRSFYRVRDSKTFLDYFEAIYLEFINTSECPHLDQTTRSVTCIWYYNIPGKQCWWDHGESVVLSSQLMSLNLKESSLLGFCTMLLRGSTCMIISSWFVHYPTTLQTSAIFYTLL